MYRFFMATPDKYHNNPLNITTIILQSTASNLETFIGPLTVLDNILSNNVDKHHIIPKNSSYVSVLSDLFSTIISGKEYVGNQYVWNTFNAFIMNKQKILIHIDNLDEYCHDKELLNLIFGDLIKIIKKEEEYKYDEMIKFETQNSLKSNVIKLFKNMTYLWITCRSYPLSLKSLLKSIKDTQIIKMQIWGSKWLPSVKSCSALDDITREYGKANFNINFTIKDKCLDLNYV